MSNEPETTYQLLHEFVAKARINLNQNIWDYLIGGTETETAVKRNRLALDSLALRPRVLVDVSEVDCGWDFFGKRIRLPVALAPVGSLESFEAGGGAHRGRGRPATFGVPVFVSSVTQPELEAIARAGSGPEGVPALRARRRRLHRRLCAAAPSMPATTRSASPWTPPSTAAASATPPSASESWRAVDPARSRLQAALNWGHIERFKVRHRIPLILKGIATVEDAERAVGAGRRCRLRLQPRRPAARSRARLGGGAAGDHRGGGRAGPRCSSTAASRAAPTSSRASRSAPTWCWSGGSTATRWRRPGRQGVSAHAGDPGERGAPEPRAARRHQLRPGEAEPRVRGAVADAAARAQRVSAAEAVAAEERQVPRNGCFAAGARHHRSAGAGLGAQREPAPRAAAPGYRRDRAAMGCWRCCCCGFRRRGAPCCR